MLEHRTLDLGPVTLHVVEAGPVDGPLVILLHGFPEFWFGWRSQIAALADAGFRVVAPDQRGYNTSGKPRGAAAYVLDTLADDIFALADALGRERFSVVGHDWGASVAWWMAGRKPARLDHLAILNAPHPAIWRRAITRDPAQRKKSRYVQALRLRWLPEWLMRRDNYAALAKAFVGAARPEAFDADAMAAYRAAWAQPGALTGAVNWYRALFLQDLPVPPPGSLRTPTLILWGDRDPFAGPELAEVSAQLCSDVRVQHLADATHWTVHDNPSEVSAALIGFLKGAA